MIAKIIKIGTVFLNFDKEKRVVRAEEPRTKSWCIIHSSVTIAGLFLQFGA